MTDCDQVRFLDAPDYSRIGQDGRDASRTLEHISCLAKRDLQRTGHDSSCSRRLSGPDTRRMFDWGTACDWLVVTQRPRVGHGNFLVVHLERLRHLSYPWEESEMIRSIAHLLVQRGSTQGAPCVTSFARQIGRAHV